MTEAAKMTTGTYRALAAVNWSSAKRMIYGRDRRTGALVLSPLHYKAGLDGVDSDSTGKRMGRAGHCATLEPETFTSRFVAYRASKTVGPGAKTAWETFKAENTARTILDGDQWDRALNLAAAVRRHPEAARLLSKGEAERVITWRDETTGLLLKARLDWIHAPAVFFDLKTDGRTIEEWAFNSTAERMFYFHQMAFYRRALASLSKVSAESVQAWVVPVESDAPHAVACREMDADSLYTADQEVAQVLAKIAECRAAEAAAKKCGESYEWPGPYETAGTMTRPGWAFPREEETEGLMIGGE